MAEHPTPNGDDIILPDGTVVGSWNGDDVKDLQVEVQRIIAEQKASGADRNNLLIRFGIPHFDHFRCYNMIISNFTISEIIAIQRSVMIFFNMLMF